MADFDGLIIMAPRLIPLWLFPLVAAVLWACVVVKETRADSGYLTIEQWSGTTRRGPFPSAAAAAADMAARFSINRGSTQTVCNTDLHTLVNDGDMVALAVSSVAIPTCGGVGHAGYIVKGICPTAGQLPVWNVSGVRVCGTVPQACTAGTKAGPGWFNMGTTPVDPPNSVCIGGCLAIYSGTNVTARALVGGVYNYYAPGQYDGIPSQFADCTSGNVLPTAAPAGVPADGCASGQTLGQVNGKNVCVDSGTGDPVNPNAAPGSTSTTRTETPATPPPGGGDQSGDGTVVTSSGGKTTTTTTTTDPTSGVRTIVTEVVSEDPQDSYCEENPEAEVCKEDESSFGGTCGAFTCDGDAIQCAIAEEQHKRNCQWFEQTTDLSTLGEAVVAGTDEGTTDNPADPDNRTEQEIDGAFDQTRWLAAGSCPSAIVFTIVGHTVTLPLDELCEMLEILGNLAVAFCLISALFIVGVF